MKKINKIISGVVVGLGILSYVGYAINKKNIGSDQLDLFKALTPSKVECYKDSLNIVYWQGNEEFRTLDFSPFVLWYDEDSRIEEVARLDKNTGLWEKLETYDSSLKKITYMHAAAIDSLKNK